MPRTSTDLAEFASINLHYAQAEITEIGDRESILRALDHIRQAETCLKIVMAEYEFPADEAGAEAEAARLNAREVAVAI
jgi:hypothetical protein